MLDFKMFEETKNNDIRELMEWVDKEEKILIVHKYVSANKGQKTVVNPMFANSDMLKKFERWVEDTNLSTKNMGTQNMDKHIVVHSFKDPERINYATFKFTRKNYFGKDDVDEIDIFEGDTSKTLYDFAVKHDYLKKMSDTERMGLKYNI